MVRGSRARHRSANALARITERIDIGAFLLWVVVLAVLLLRARPPTKVRVTKRRPSVRSSALPVG